MPCKIKFLDNDIINKIAAGEIIERPASIVKELIENSIDAGSIQIKIFVEHGGMRSISILDNGCGISREDAIMAFERHATSKITKSEDLFEIKTMGFRGEALASIAAVSQVEMETKENKSPVGSKIDIHFGIPKLVTDVGCHIGTKITITHLFHNA
ncbi:ATP-binding protein [Candidatus Desantisbacteria bacterium]|nr:ATP-binding protein [Candidatus Desantisbacteria bacterium]